MARTKVLGILGCWVLTVYSSSKRKKVREGNKQMSRYLGSHTEDGYVFLRLIMLAVFSD